MPNKNVNITSIHIFIATSLDGFIAREDDSLDWLPQENSTNEDTGYESFIEGVDGLIMGRSTFQTVLSFGNWPYKKPVIVLSKTLTQSDVIDELKEKVRILNLSPKEVLEFTRKEGWKRAYLDGGKVIQSFLRDNLVEDIIITTIPVLIGTGKTLFGKLPKDIHLSLLNSQFFESGMTQNHYKIIRKLI